MNRAEAAMLGGKATASKWGHEWAVERGKMGGRPRVSLTLSEINERGECIGSIKELLRGLANC